MKRLIAILCAVGGLAAFAQAKAPAAKAPAQKRLVLHYTFDEPVGKEVKDHSGNNITGTVLLGSEGLLKSVPGRVGNAFFFAGVRNPVKDGLVNPQISTTKVWTPELLDGMTIEFWIKLGPEADWQRGLMNLVVCAPGNYGPPFVVTYLWNMIVVHYEPGKDSNFRAKYSQDIRNQWRHVAITYDGATKTSRIYLDGDLRCEKTGLAMDPPKSKYPTLTVGGAFGGKGSGLNGAIDELKIYNYPMTQEEIIQHAKFTD
jgi:hypothetical protein